MSQQTQQGRTGAAIDGDDMTIAYLGGGSRQWAPNFVRDMALSELDGEVRLYDVNHESAQLNARFSNWVEEEYETTGTWTYEASKISMRP